MTEGEGRTVRIACQGAETRQLDELVEFQGNLKDLHEDDYLKLRTEILTTGFAFAPHVWIQDGKAHILDGHQRVRVLRKLAEDGFTIPPIPVVPVEAANVEAAKRRVLQGTAQYGRMTEQGLYEFMGEAGVGFEELDKAFRFPDIEMWRFKAGYGPEQEFQPDDSGAAQLDHRATVTCPECGHEFTP